MSIPAVFPVSRYADAPAALAWLVRAFGFTVVSDFRQPDGLVAHAELRRGASVLGISSSTPPTRDNPWSAVRDGVYLRVDDIDGSYERARRAHADVVIALRDTSYGSREYSVRDPEGRLWGVGTYAMSAPDGPPDLFVAPRFDDGVAALAWMEAALGFTTGLKVIDARGRIEHAEAWIGDDAVMVSGVPPTDGKWADNVQCVCGFVADPDAHFATATAAGATIVQPPTDTPYGARAYYVRDPEGFLWGFSTYQPAKKTGIKS